MTKEKVEQQFEFQSEVKKLLDILVYSLYQHKDVFLRELISNSADALSKIRFELLSSRINILDRDDDLKIELSINEKSKTLVIEDNGIGMSREELINNLGTIAHSGTLDFLRASTTEGKKATEDLIGQFGVGFYASFMVADEIKVYTRSAQEDSKAWLWVSSGDNSFTITETVKKKRGTRIELKIKNDEQIFLKSEEIERIIKTHSRFVPYPILLENKKVDRISAIWSQPKSELKKEDYTDFYKSLPVYDNEPATYLHLAVDAPVQFQALLYIPSKNDDYFGFSNTDSGVDLYSRKVLIQKGNKDILPEYLRFIKGIVDSEEIPLNISRETVQNHGKVKKIHDYLVRKTLDHLATIKRDEYENYTNIWNQFHHFFKEGLIKDWTHREHIAKLLLFECNQYDSGKKIDLDTYLAHGEQKKEKIYYLSGQQRNLLEKNPALEAFNDSSIPVLFLTEPIDEFVVEHLREYQKIPFVNIQSADVSIKTKIKTEPTEDNPTPDASPLIAYLKQTFSDKISDVRVSERLVNSPCMLVMPSQGPSAQMEKLLKMTDKSYQFSKRILEINPENQLIRNLTTLLENDFSNPFIKMILQNLVDLSLLKEGLINSVDEILPNIFDLFTLTSNQANKIEK